MGNPKLTASGAFIVTPSPSLVSPVSASVQGRYQLRSYTNASQLVAFQPELERLRLRSREASRLLPLPQWLAAAHPHKAWKARVFLLWAHDSSRASRKASPGPAEKVHPRIAAAVLLFEQLCFGIPTGHFRGGEALGEPLIFCEADREHELLALTLQHLLNQHRGFLVLLDRPLDTSALDNLSGGIKVHHQSGSNNWELPLNRDLDTTMATLGHRTRRNLRHGLRTIEKKQLEEVVDLDGIRLQAAVSFLKLRATHTCPAEVTATRLKLMTEIPGCFAMGLRDSAGNWLSYLIGRRLGTTTEVFWQSNLQGYESGSLCTMMRAVLMREEVRRGTQRLRYIAGTCPHMQHCCVASPSRETTLARRGLRLLLVRGLLHTRLPMQGHPLRKHFQRTSSSSF